MRPAFLFLVACTLALAGCMGPVSLRNAVLGYDETISTLQSEMLVLNIARAHHQLPIHFTVTSSVTATFEYTTELGFTGNYFEPAGLDSHSFSVGARVKENPTLSIVPLQGKEFTKRILTPMGGSKFGFLVFQGTPIDMVMRLMADGIEVQNLDGTFQRFILNWPSAPEEYKEFRQRAMHLAWLNDNRQLFVRRLSFGETERVTLTGPPSAGDFIEAREKGYIWRRVGEGNEYELIKGVKGRVVITNYDTRQLSSAERQDLNTLAAANPRNYILVDIRPGHAGGDWPLFGALKLRSFNFILAFVAAGIERIPEFHVEPDPRTGAVSRNPLRALAVKKTVLRPRRAAIKAKYRGKTYSVPKTPWDLEAFNLLYHLFQITVTDVSSAGAPAITISK